MSTTFENVLQSRRRILEQFPTLPMAFSIGGRRGHLTGPMGGGLRLGGFVIIDDGTGTPLVGQLESLEIAEKVLGDFETKVDIGLAEGMSVRTARATPTVRIVTGEMALLGRLKGESLARELPSDGFDECLYEPATEEQTRLVLEAMSGGQPTIEVGEVLGFHVAAQLHSRGFSRHTFLCGQSGSGKTYATGVLLERLRLSTTLPIIVLDPNSDHVHLGEVSDGATDNPAASTYRSMGGDVLVVRGRGRGGDRILALHFSDLQVSRQAQLLELDPVADLDAYAAFRLVASSLAHPYSINAVADAASQSGTQSGAALARRIENLGIADWGVWCRPGEESLVDASPLNRQCLVVDLGSLELPNERLMISIALLRSLWARREAKQPVLLVVDEAHNVFPASPASPAERAATEVGIAIAAEGRKYGLHLLVATQRPSKVHINVVSQCDNLALLRVNSIVDVEDLCRLFSHVPAGLIRQAPEFSQGEVLFAGPIAERPLVAKIGARLSPEGGGDVPTDWA